MSKSKSPRGTRRKPIQPSAPSVGDRLLAGACMGKITVDLMAGDEHTEPWFDVGIDLAIGLNGPDAGELIAGLVQHFQASGPKGGAK
jgi:hypothetical protein